MTEGAAMILQELIIRKNELVQLQVEIAGNSLLDAEDKRAQPAALILQIEQLTNQIVLRRKQAELKTKKQSNPEYFQPGFPLNQQLQSINDLDEQYKTALAKMLLDEVLFRLRCRVEEEKKWWFWNRSNVAKVLARYEAMTFSSILKLLEYLQDDDAKALCSDFAQEVSRIAIQEGLSVGGSSEENSSLSVKQGSPEIVYQPVGATDSPATHYNILRERTAKLKEIFAQKEAGLGVQFQREEANQRNAKTLGFDQIPEYSTMPEEDKRKYEVLFLRARYPGFVRASINVARSEDSQPEPHKAQSESSLFECIKKAIADIYSYQNGVDIDEDLLLKHVRDQCGFWGTWSTEYKRVKKLLDVAKQQSLTYAASHG